MIKSLSILLFFVTTILSVQADALSKFLELYGETRAGDHHEYYWEIGDESGEALIRALHERVQKNHKANGYSQARRYLYNEVENKDGAVTTLYSGLMIPGRGMDYKEKGDQNRDGYTGDFVNCEHVWPQSKFGKASPMRADMHHLYPTLAMPNNKRGSYPFGMVKNPSYETSFGSRLGGHQYEPANPAKGNVARAVFYFVTRYYRENIFQKTNSNDFFKSRLAMLMQWHEQDPPDEWEKRRNEQIFKYQRNRNPFIDHPEFVQRIGTRGFTAVLR